VRRYTTLDTQADTSYNHLLTPDLNAPIVYMKVKFRFGASGSTTTQLLGVIAWENWSAQDATTASPSHILFKADETRCQIYQSLAATTQVFHTYSSAYTTQWQEAEIAIDTTAGAVVVRCPDGTVISYEHSLASSLTDFSIGDFEVGLTAPNTDKRVEVLQISCATTTGMTADVAQAHDDLLVLEGYGSAWTPPPAGDVTFDAVGAGAANTGGGVASPAAINWSHTATGTDRLVLVVLDCGCTNQNGDNTTFTRSVTYGGSAMTYIGAAHTNAGTTAPTYWFEVWGIMLTDGALTGAQDVAVSVAKTSATIHVSGNSCSYTNVDALPTLATETGTEAGTTLSITQASATGRMAMGILISESTSQGSFNQTSRFTFSQLTARPPMIVGDAAGAASVTFSCTRSSGVDYAEGTLDIVAVS
jgi:hypothetical protein